MLSILTIYTVMAIFTYITIIAKYSTPAGMVRWQEEIQTNSYRKSRIVLHLASILIGICWLPAIMLAIIMECFKRVKGLTDPIK